MNIEEIQSHADIAAVVRTLLKQKRTHVVLKPQTRTAFATATGINFDAQQKPDPCWNVPRGELFRALELIDAQATCYRLTPKQTPELYTDRAASRHFWQRMRQLKLTRGTYNGRIYRADGTRCRTVQDLAMLDTRSFWEERPPHPCQRALHTASIPDWK